MSPAGQNVQTQAARLSTAVPIGELGRPIGTVVAIEAHPHRPEKLLQGTVGLVVVEKVEGLKLDPPVSVRLRNVDTDSLNADTHLVLHGYESGAWIGSPDGVEPVQQFPFHFSIDFIVTSADAPKDLKIH